MKKKWTATILSMLCCVAVVGCGSAQNSAASGTEGKGGNNAENNISQEQEVVSGPIDVKEHYYVNINDDNSLDCYFDTSLFDRTKFDNKMVFDGIEVPLPLGSPREIDALGIDLARESVIYDDGDLLLNNNFKKQDLEPEANVGIRDVYWGKQCEDGSFELYFYADTSVKNYAGEVKNIMDCPIYTFTMDNCLEGTEEEMPKAFGIESGEFNVDSVVERFGLPVHYEVDTLFDDLFLYYNYGDYHFEFGFSFDSLSKECELKEFRYYSESTYVGTGYLDACKELGLE